MPFQSEIHEIEEAIDAFSELRVRLEKNNPSAHQKEHPWQLTML